MDFQLLAELFVGIFVLHTIVYPFAEKSWLDRVVAELRGSTGEAVKEFELKRVHMWKTSANRAILD